MQDTTLHTHPVFENNGLSELEKAWKENSQLDTDILIRYAEDNFENKTYAVSLFLADRILKEKNPSENAVTRLRFIRAESLYEFKFYRQAYPDYMFYVAKQGGSEELNKKMRYCKRMIHTGNNGSLLFIAVFGLSIVLMFWALYYVQMLQITDADGNKTTPFANIGLNGDYVLYSGIAMAGLLVFGLFYRYVVIARMK